MAVPTETIMVRGPHALMERVRAIAEVRGVSEWIRQAIEEKLERDERKKE